MQHDECLIGSWSIQFQTSFDDCAQAKVVNLNAITVTTPVENISPPQSSIVSVASSGASSQISPEFMHQFWPKNASVWTASKRNACSNYDQSHRSMWLKRAWQNDKMQSCELTLTPLRLPPVAANPQKAETLNAHPRTPASRH